MAVARSMPTLLLLILFCELILCSIESVQTHQFFHGVNWEALRKKAVNSPLKLDSNEPNECVRSNLGIGLSSEYLSDDDGAFDGFSYALNEIKYNTMMV